MINGQASMTGPSGAEEGTMAGRLSAAAAGARALASISAGAGLVLGMATVPGTAWAADVYPSRPVRVVVPFTLKLATVTP